MSIQGKSSAAGKTQQGVPINKPGVTDSKTILLQTGNDYPFFTLIKFNAIEGETGIVTISRNYMMEKTQRTLSQSLEKAGIMQCVLDISEEFDITIDYFLQCSWQELALLIGELNDFGIDELGENLPESTKEFLLKNAERIDAHTIINALEKSEAFLDNQIGLAFINESAYLLIKNNTDIMGKECGRILKNNYTKFNTNINSEDMKSLERILSFLSAGGIEYPRDIIISSQSENSDIIHNIFN